MKKMKTAPPPSKTSLVITPELQKELDDAKKAFDKMYSQMQSETGAHRERKEEDDDLASRPLFFSDLGGLDLHLSLEVWERVLVDEHWTVEKAERMAAGVRPDLTELPLTDEMKEIRRDIRHVEAKLKSGFRKKTEEEREEDGIRHDRVTLRLQQATDELELFYERGETDPERENSLREQVDRLEHLVRDALLDTKAPRIAYNNIEINNLKNESIALNGEFRKRKLVRLANKEQIMRQSAGIPEIAWLLRTRDYLWKRWWFEDFQRFENDLFIRIRGLPEWILRQRLPQLPEDASERVQSEYSVLEQYANVPWRRFYAWCAFFERRCAKMVATNALLRAGLFEPDVRAPVGCVVPAPNKVHRWRVGSGKNCYTTELEWDEPSDDPRITPNTMVLEAVCFGTLPPQINVGESGSPYFAWECFKSFPLAAQQAEDDTQLDMNHLCSIIGNTPALLTSPPEMKAGSSFYTYNFLGNGPVFEKAYVDQHDLTEEDVHIIIPDDVVRAGIVSSTQYENNAGLRMGIIMMSFIAWYNGLEQTPFTPTEFAKWTENLQNVETYEQYERSFEDLLQQRHAAYQNIVENEYYNVNFLHIVPWQRLMSHSDSDWALAGLPVCPMRGEVTRRDPDAPLNRIREAGGVRFLGSSAPPNEICRVCDATPELLMQCKNCKCATYCSRECQIMDWTEGGHKNACSVLKNQ